jgi:transposase
VAKPLVPDDLRAVVAPLLPPERPRLKGGSPSLPQRAVPRGILFVLKSGIPGETLPREMGRGSGMTSPRQPGSQRLRDGQAAEVRERLRRVLLDRPGRAQAIDGSRACIDSTSVLARGCRDRPQPTDRGRTGSKHHLVTGAQGIPLAVRITAANRHDSRIFDELIGAVPPLRQGRDRPCQRPAKLHGAKACDVPRCHHALHRRRIAERIARRGAWH